MIRGIYGILGIALMVLVVVGCAPRQAPDAHRYLIMVGRASATRMLMPNGTSRAAVEFEPQCAATEGEPASGQFQPFRFPQPLLLMEWSGKMMDPSAVDLNQPLQIVGRWQRIATGSQVPSNLLHPPPPPSEKRPFFRVKQHMASSQYPCRDGKRGT
jgi:hypothetical protein